jgi:L-lactate dehydrogenase complex protein LldE
MRVALFVPCYVDQLTPEVGLASLRLLRSVGVEPIVPTDTTCCGQPFLTAGEIGRARVLGSSFVDTFADFDFIVTPSGSCAATLRKHLDRLAPGAVAQSVAERTLELCEFLVQGHLELPPAGRYPHRVGLHASCHALRELRLGTTSETREPVRIDPARMLLERIEGLDLIDLARRDECCGFGGVFSVEEEAVSCRMGLDRLEDHRRGRAEVLTSTDASCLIHLDGLARKRNFPLRVLHVAEILAASLDRPATNEGLDGSR